MERWKEREEGAKKRERKMPVKKILGTKKNRKGKNEKAKNEKTKNEKTAHSCNSLAASCA